MAAIRAYEVVQERRVKVVAESPTKAIEVASSAFVAGHVDESFAGVRSDVRETSIEAREDY